MPVAPTLALGPTPRQEWRLSLRNTARVAAAEGGQYYFPPTSPESQRLGGGVSYSALTSGGQTGSFDPCENPSITFTQRDPALNFLPWAVHVWEECPTIGSYNVADVYARAADRLCRRRGKCVDLES